MFNPFTFIFDAYTLERLKRISREGHWDSWLWFGMVLFTAIHFTVWAVIMWIICLPAFPFIWYNKRRKLP